MQRMNRRDFLKAGCLLSASSMGLLSPLVGCQKSSVAVNAVADSPNIIVVITDDQGYGDLGRHGHPLLKTPNLDALYDQSVRFSNFYVSPACSPTRASLLTGMHEFRNGVTHTLPPREHLNIKATILPQLLKPAGYTSGLFGKWHLGSDKGYRPYDRGFDLAVEPQGVHNSSNFDAGQTRNGVREKTKGFREDVIFDEAMKFIESSKDRPFFCYIATYSPHEPLVAPEEFIAPYRGKTTDRIATFLGMIANIDWNYGRLTAKLKELGIDDNTIIIFMNDNGQTVGLDLYNADMRGCKCTAWHGGTRAISLWHWANKWKPRTEEALTAHLDFLPTITELAGAAIPDGLKPQLEGYSLAPLLESEKGDFPRDRKLFGHVGRWPNGMADSHKYTQCHVRKGHYLMVRSRPCDEPECTPEVRGDQCYTLKLVEKGAKDAVYTDGNAQFHWGVTPKDGWALYDTKKDPECQNNLADKMPELVKELTADYDKWWDSVRPYMINEQ